MNMGYRTFRPSCPRRAPAGMRARPRPMSLFSHGSGPAPHLALIESAQKQIDIEIYTVNDPLIRLALLAAQKRGVKLRILQEPETCKRKL